MNLKPPLIDLLYQAMHAKIGIVVSTNNVTNLRAALYKVRREANDPDLADLTFSPSRTMPEQELWILKNESRFAETHTLPEEG